LLIRFQPLLERQNILFSTAFCIQKPMLVVMAAASDRWTLPDLQKTVQWCKVRNSQGIRCVIDVLGEYAANDDQVSLSLEEYRACMRTISEQKLDASITVKLTALGSLYDKTRCKNNVLEIFKEAISHQVSFEIDMETKNLVPFAIETAMACANEKHLLTLALQAYLDRTPEDAKVACEAGIKIRLVKGTYHGDITNFEMVQKQFMKLVEKIFESQNPFSVGTHDPEIIDWVMDRASSNRSLVEFGFLKGLGDQTKTNLVRQGWRVSEYVPFGKSSEAYVTRRLNYLRTLDRLGRHPAP
jgi:proline dehydrogenase